MFVEPTSFLDLLIALIPAAIAASNPAAVFAMGSAALLFGQPGFSPCPRRRYSIPMARASRC